MPSKLAIGTAQFGSVYGVANKAGCVPEDEVHRILVKAKQEGIDMLDTASGYGKSETVLGRDSTNGWKIVSKLGALPGECVNVKEWVVDQVEGSLRRLNVSSLYALLIHNPDQLFESRGREIISALQALKSAGLVKKLGVSIYDSLDLEAISTVIKLDIVQAPLNALDSRLIDSGWSQRLFRQGVEIHVRSVFLQGLLLMKAGSRPEKFQKWSNLWVIWHEWIRANEVTPLQACLRHVLSFPEISKIVVGVESVNQLGEICAAIHGAPVDLPPLFRSNDKELLDPFRWNTA